MQYRCVPYNPEDLLAKASDFAKHFAPITSIIGVIIIIAVIVDAAQRRARSVVLVPVASTENWGRHQVVHHGRSAETGIQHRHAACSLSNRGTGLDELFAVVRNCKPCILLSSIGLAETGGKEVSLEARRGYAIVADSNFES